MIISININTYTHKISHTTTHKDFEDYYSKNNSFGPKSELRHFIVNEHYWWGPTDTSIINFTFDMQYPQVIDGFIKDIQSIDIFNDLIQKAIRNHKLQMIFEG